MQLTRPGRSDAGFTLVELIATIAILGIIMVPLGNAVIGILKNSDATAARADASRAAQIGATYFAQDVETLGKRDYAASGAPLQKSILLSGETGPACGPSGNSAVVRFLSDSHDTKVSPAQLRAVVISWAMISTTADQQLVRTRCVDGALVSTVTVARSLTSAPTLTCSTTCNDDAVPPRVPATVTLSFVVAPDKTAPYTVTLTGARRQT